MKTKENVFTVRTRSLRSAKQAEVQAAKGGKAECEEGVASTGSEKEQGKTPEKEPEWSADATRLLISEFKGKKNPYAPASWVYDSIAGTLQKNGFSFRPSQVRTYWAQLINAYSNYGSGKPTPVPVEPYYA